MIKCYFVDVKNISSDLPRSSFVESELEQLANLILATDGLLRPLILKENGVEKYTVVEGSREYYAALRAKEKDSRKAEMVNAFVISDQIQQSAVSQLLLLNEAKSATPIPIIDPTDSIVEKLLPTLLSAISQLIQPMVAQLAEQKQILDTLTIDRVSVDSEHSQLEILRRRGYFKSKRSATANDKQPDLVPKHPDIPPSPIPIAVVDPKPAKAEKTKSEKTSKLPTKSKTESTLPESIDSTKVNPEKTSKPPAKGKKASTPSESINPTKVNPEKTAKPPAKSKKASTLVESIDPTNATNTLNLINTLSQNDLSQKMGRSGISKTVLDLVPNIIASRDSQPDRKFDTWEIVSTAKIKGLGPAKIKEIIDKLK
jgi:hypothetical protein